MISISRRRIQHILECNGELKVIVVETMKKVKWTELVQLWGRLFRLLLVVDWGDLANKRIESESVHFVGWQLKQLPQFGQLDSHWCATFYWQYQRADEPLEMLLYKSVTVVTAAIGTVMNCYYEKLLAFCLLGFPCDQTPGRSCT